MGRAKPITEFIKDTEYWLAKYKAVLEVYPDARCTQYADFSSKLVNKQYTKWEFFRSYGGLNVSPYCELVFTHNGVTEILKIHSQPRSSRLAYLKRWVKPQTIKFSRLKFNMKNNQFKEDMLNECHVEIMKFIKDNPGCQLDKKHLDPRLQKLLVFS